MGALTYYMIKGLDYRRAEHIVQLFANLSNKDSFDLLLIAKVFVGHLAIKVHDGEAVLVI